MFYVYILTNESRSKHYVGYTADLQRRLREHKAGSSYWSKRLVKPILYYYESYFFEADAKQRERKLKQYGSAYVGLLKRIGLKKLGL